MILFEGMASSRYKVSCGSGGRTLYVGGHGNLASTVSILDKVWSPIDMTRNNFVAGCSTQVERFYNFTMCNAKKPELVEGLEDFR